MFYQKLVGMDCLHRVAAAVGSHVSEERKGALA